MHLLLLALASGFIGATVQVLQVDVFEQAGRGEAGCEPDPSMPTFPATQMHCLASCGVERECQGVLYNAGKRSCGPLANELGCVPESHVYWRRRGCQHGGKYDATMGCLCRSGFSGRECEQIGEHTLLHGTLMAPMFDPYTEGVWGGYETCPTGSYAAGMQLKIHPPQGSGDDTAVNVIRLLCLQAWSPFSEVAAITSNTMTWGNMEEKLFCPRDFWIVQFRLVYEPNQGGASDDTGVNGLAVTCRGPGIGGSSTAYLEQRGWWEASVWSTWSPQCPPGTAVCALITRVEPDQGSVWGVDVDDGALTGAEMSCCAY
jgi:hypothetical protein